MRPGAPLLQSGLWECRYRCGGDSKRQGRAAALPSRFASQVHRALWELSLMRESRSGRHLLDVCLSASALPRAWSFKAFSLLWFFLCLPALFCHCCKHLHWHLLEPLPGSLQWLAAAFLRSARGSADSLLFFMELYSWVDS